METGASRRLRLGVAGLGRAFTLMLPTLARHPRIELAGAADPRPAARRRFEADFRTATYEDVQSLCADPGVDAVYVATPHELHAEHAVMAARAGKHVLVEKPMAVTLEEADAMGEAARASGVHLIVGPSHSFDTPVAKARALIDGGALGRVRMVTAMYFTDFIYRPRRPEELDTARGGGVIFSQAAHQVDIVRLLAGAPLAAVSAQAGAWDPARSTEGAYGALLRFANGVFATLAYGGYGHFDGDELCGGVSELGRAKDDAAYGAARRALAAPAGGLETAAKNARSFGGERFAPAPDPIAHEHFGFVLASCEHADVRPMPRGVLVYGDERSEYHELPAPAIPRGEVIDELCDAALLGKAPLHDAAWGRATLEACLAILRSAREGREVRLGGQ